MPANLKARATNAANPNTAYADVTGNPLTLLNWAAPIANDAVTLGFQQAVAANDALRAGAYSKTLTVHAGDDNAMKQGRPRRPMGAEAPGAV